MPVINEMLERLHTQRGRAWEAQKALLDEIRGREVKDPTGEDREALARMDADIDGLDVEIREWVNRDRRETEAAQARSEYEKVVRPTVIDRQDNDMDAVVRSFLRREPGSPKVLELDLTQVALEKRAIRGGKTGKEFRDLAKVTSAAGGATVPTTLVRTLYDFLEIYSGVRTTNVTVITTASGEPMNFPKVVSHGTAAIVGEGSALAELDPTFGQLAITPYKYGQLTQVTNELITDTAVDILGFVADDAARAIARVTDAAYVNGSGSNQPQGFLPLLGTAATIQTVATGVPSYANLVNGIFSINAEYRARGSEWLMGDATAGTIRLLADTTGRPLWEMSLQVGVPDRLLGFPIRYDPNLGAIGTAASTPIVFGDFSAYYIRDVSTIRFERSDEFAFSSDLVTFRCAFRTGGGLIDNTGLKKFMEPTT